MPPITSRSLANTFKNIYKHLRTCIFRFIIVTILCSLETEGPLYDIERET